MSMFDESENITTNQAPPPAKTQKYEIRLDSATNTIYFRITDISREKDTWGKESIREYKFDADDEFLAWGARSLNEALRRKWEYP